MGAAASSLVARWAAESRVERSILLWGNVSSQLHLISPGCPRPNSALIVQKSGLKPVHPSIHPNVNVIYQMTPLVTSNQTIQVYSVPEHFLPCYLIYPKMGWKGGKQEQTFISTPILTSRISNYSFFYTEYIKYNLMTYHYLVINIFD